MTDPEKITALKKAYADIILNTAKEAAARVMVSEKRARGFQLELVSVRDEALRTCLRLKQMYDSKVKEAEMISMKKQEKIEELEAQLGEAEDIVGELRMELRESRSLLEKLVNGRIEEKKNKPSLAREDSSNGVIKPHLSVCSSYKENKDPSCDITLPSILSRHREGEALGTDIAKTEDDKESPSRCIKFTFTRKRKKDGSSSEEGSSDESKNRRQKTGEKDNGYLDSFNTESCRDSRRVAQVARQLLPFSEKKSVGAEPV